MAEEKITVVSVEILHLDKKGYGPEGKHTRREWRADCLENLLAGKAQFLAWQKSWLALAEKNDLKCNFAIEQTFSDGAKKAWLDYDRKSSTLDFSGHAFVNDLDCGAYQCLQDASFFDASFSDGAYFSEASFSGDAYFIEASFSGYAYFSEASFSGYAYFHKTKFSSSSHFTSVKFNGPVIFENAIFENVGHFEQANFQGEQSTIPAFRGCKIDSTRLEFSDETHFTQAGYSENAIKNISFLKRLADQHGQVDQALEFNAMELRAKRKLAWEMLYSAKQTEGFWFCAFTGAYEVVSNFGRSFMRPLGALLGLCCLTWVLAFNAADDTPTSPCDVESSQCAQSKTLLLSPSRAATEYTLYRASGLFHFADKGRQQRLFAQAIEPPWMRVWGLVTSLLSTILFFLTALGLRNRYRIK
jgi:uncharacterized protein YjbI with pentapeptide repeats